MRKVKRRNQINFHLESSLNQRLHLYIYLATVLFIILMYLLTITFFDRAPAFMIAGFLSFIIGVGMIFYRGRIVEIIAKRMHEREYAKRKVAGKENLRSTIRNITPRPARVKLNVRPMFSLRAFIDWIKNLFRRKPKNPVDYIEVKE